MNESTHDHYVTAELCLLAGKIILQNGGETYRVEDTMTRIAAAYGYPDSQSFVMPTGIMFAINGANPLTRLVRISDRMTDLHKVTLVNDLSRKVCSGSLSAVEALEQLREIERVRMLYPGWLQVAAVTVASGCFLLMFRGGWNDFIPAMLTGGLGFALLIGLHRLVSIRFFAEFLSSMLIGTLAILLVRTGIGHELDLLIIGSVMPLVPGLLITSAVRDLMAGHLVSGLSKGAEALLTSSAIGAGIAVTLSVFNLGGA
jgi:uncharacterized membrane protein YjjP (DUF1212 family)